MQWMFCVEICSAIRVLSIYLTLKNVQTNEMERQAYEQSVEYPSQQSFAVMGTEVQQTTNPKVQAEFESNY
jgi:hypothetical protein